MTKPNHAWKFTYHGLTLCASLRDSKYVPDGKELVALTEPVRILPVGWLNRNLYAIDLAYRLLEMLEQDCDGMVEIPLVNFSGQEPHAFLPSSSIEAKTPGHDMMTAFISQNTDTYLILKSEAAAAALLWLEAIERDYAHNP